MPPSGCVYCPASTDSFFYHITVLRRAALGKIGVRQGPSPNKHLPDTLMSSRRVIFLKPTNLIGRATQVHAVSIARLALARARQHAHKGLHYLGDAVAVDWLAHSPTSGITEDCRMVMLKPEGRQPRRNVHGRSGLKSPF
ncbi:hypothetical protein IF1G_10022 [Cordyceps javanica]|uniref:Uncharacterized protein n=1 Tax=Cordyceps javanica TaxID=43265 RepID=A0A545UNV5_9HYPO|nr:hypothetical protein IF1G_10022 [Cordyceps javanica]